MFFFIIIAILTIIFFLDYLYKDVKISDLKKSIDDLNLLYEQEHHKNIIANKNIIRLKEENYKLKNNEYVNMWKDKYTKLQESYERIYDDLYYLKNNYNNMLNTYRLKIQELEEKLLQKYTVEDIENINDWRDFEEFIAEQFKKKNFEVILTSQTNDGGKDIIIEKNNIKTYIECKYWNKNKTIGREEIQKLAGATMMDGIKNALFITTSTYNDNAIEAANALNKNGFNIKLWTTENLLRFINN